MSDETIIRKAYEVARERYSSFGVDTESALKTLLGVPLSLHCWQGDDVGGFEKPAATLSGGGIQVTGNYPGKARSIDELRMDLKQAYRLIPGRHRLNLHAIYGEFGGKLVDRDQITPEHFRGWIDWVKQHQLKLDFNATYFSHPKADSGFTLSHPDRAIREFWVEHSKRCREISAAMGRALGDPCVHNIWIPDGSKDIPVDRWSPREFLRQSLDEIYRTTFPMSEMRDAVESKLFGIGSEAYVVGSHEFYMGYALTRKKMVCLDMGHFHPTELVADKISALLLFFDEILLHVSRGVRWDSDHVVILNDDVRSLAEEIVRSKALNRVRIALDYFDASMNRIGAWVLGARSTQKALLAALLEPQAKLREAEGNGDYFARLALLEETRLLPLGAVWDYFCLSNSVPAGEEWIAEIHRYEHETLSKRT
ncbi:MAG: L-rhamnose isomerase [Ignavibacteriales bacterium]|nr:L-rhamnose isomerase [Ignavibacteriales bacterium]